MILHQTLIKFEHSSTETMQMIQKLQQSRGKIKTMLAVFSDWEDVVYHKFAPPGQTVRSAASVFLGGWEMH